MRGSTAGCRLVAEQRKLWAYSAARLTAQTDVIVHVQLPRSSPYRVDINLMGLWLHLESPDVRRSSSQLACKEDTLNGFRPTMTEAAHAFVFSLPASFGSSVTVAASCLITVLLPVCLWLQQPQTAWFCLSSDSVLRRARIR